VCLSKQQKRNKLVKGRIARTGPGGAHQTVLDQDRVRQLSAPGFRPATVTVRASEVTHVRLDRAG
jgi:hypothetical protein